MVRKDGHFAAAVIEFGVGTAVNYGVFVKMDYYHNIKGYTDLKVGDPVKVNAVAAHPKQVGQ